MSKPQQGGQPQQQPQQQSQGQPAGQAQAGQQSHQQLEHALAQHAQAHGLSLQGVNWAAVVGALEQLFAAISHGGQQPQATP